MDRRKLYFILVCIVAGFGLAAFWTGLRRPAARRTVNVMATDTRMTIDQRTDLPPADPAIVGHWISSDKPGWHKVYYDDYDEKQQLFWGKEWDESDDVMEEDLSYHGNGWFRWTKNKDTLFEYHTMDLTEVPIAHRYKIRINDSTDIEQLEIAHRSHYHFVKQ